MRANSWQPKVIPKDVKIIKEEAPGYERRHGRRCSGRRRRRFHGRRDRRRDWRHGRSATTAEADGIAHPSGRQRAGRIVGQQSSASLSAAGAPDAHLRHRAVARHHLQDGSVESLEVLSGHPLLVRAAMDAVQQWKYKPTLLNGEPVEVDTTIDVIFSLNQ